MQYLPLLERLFPDARFVHLVRDGRDAALSFLAVPRRDHDRGLGLSHATPSGFACQWASEVRDARALGERVGERYLELRYEELVVDPATELERVCAFAELRYDEAMLGYVGQTDSAKKRHQQRLNEPPRVGRAGLADGDVGRHDRAAFEEVAGDLLAELGYEVTTPRPRPAATGRLPREDGGVAGRRRRHAALAALATSTSGARRAAGRAGVRLKSDTGQRQAGASRPRKATSNPLSEK